MKIKLCSMVLLAALGLGAAISSTRAQNPAISGPCCDSCDKVCQPKSELKKVTKRVYSCDWEDFCLPKCSFRGGLLGNKDCAECGGGVDCGRVRTKKYLVVKLKTHEECVTKCVPQPACVTETVAAPHAAPPAPLPARP